MKNRLIYEKSPYLRRHADDAIDWFPWGDAAFEKAQREEKPIFLSIGYSTCYWCHVMAKETFADDQVATRLNSDFVSIKVDREERPDVDAVYMNVCNSLHGGGGWPLSAFLTPTGRPFFVGTYFPKESNGRQTGFMELLEIIAAKWREDPTAVAASAKNITEAIRQRLAKRPGPASDPLGDAVAHFKQTYDAENGGFGRGAKFPTPQKLSFLREIADIEAYGGCEQMLAKTLKAMVKGGLYDAVGGGFFRYATEPTFSYPHFEKTLRDNALLISVYAAAFAATDDDFYLAVAEDTAAWLLREMQDKNGCFFSAQDADSDGVEGGFYLLTAADVEDALGDAAATVFRRRFNMAADEQMPSLPTLGEYHYKDDLSPVAENRRTLVAWRKQRRELFTDEKVLTAWNAMAISAFCDLYRVTGNDRYLAVAERARKSLIAAVAAKMPLSRGYKDDEPLVDGGLEDHAWLIGADLDFYSAVGDKTLLEAARILSKRTVDHFFDREEGGFYLRDKEKTPLIFSYKEVEDGDHPCANSVMAENMRRLALLSDDTALAAAAEKQMDFMAEALGDTAYAAPYYLRTLCRQKNEPPFIRVVTGRAGVLRTLSPHMPLRADIVLSAPSDAYPTLDDETTYYVCVGQHCLPPTTWRRGEEAPWQATAFAPTSPS